MAILETPPVIPAHPNIVEIVALLEDPGIQSKDRDTLQQVLHDTVHLVKERDGSVRRLDPITD